MTVRSSLSRPASIVRAATRRPLLLALTLLALVVATVAPSAARSGSSAPLSIPPGPTGKLFGVGGLQFKLIKLPCPPFDLPCEPVYIEIYFEKEPCPGCPWFDLSRLLDELVYEDDRIVTIVRLDDLSRQELVAGSAPDFSSDNRFVAYLDVNGRLSTIPRAGRTAQQLGSLTDIVQLAIAPDNSAIAVTRAGSGGRGELYVVQVDGSGQTLLDVDMLTGHAISWAPDSSALVFASDRTGDANIYQVARSGGSAVQLTFNGGTNPRWSPDGSNIAFESRGDLRVIGRDGSDERTVAQGRAATWSPSGLMLAFLPSQSGAAGVFAVDLTGAPAFQVTDTELLYLTWVPE